MDNKSTANFDDSILIDALNTSNWESSNIFDSLQAGNVTAINATTVFWEGFEETVNKMMRWKERFNLYKDQIIPALNVDDIYNAKSHNKTGIIIGWQNACPIENDLKRLHLFYELGVRIIQITYNERNLLGNGCYERNDEGLSNFGLDAIKLMNELGILIDLSHVGDKTTNETIEKSNMPVAITHANSRELFNHPRNKPNDTLNLLKERDGVIGANGFPTLLRKDYESTIEDYVDAIEDLIEKVGINHVGIGSDFCQDQPYSFWQYLFSQQGTKFKGIPTMTIKDPHHHPDGIEDPSQMPNIAEHLSDRGYSKLDVDKIIGGNWVRLFKTVWKQ